MPLTIAINCGGMPFNHETIPSGKSLGGSESACYFMGRELAKLGHKVVVFTNAETGGKDDLGVIYEQIGVCNEQWPLGQRWMMSTRAPWDVVIVQRHPQGFMAPYNSKLNIWWLHDLALFRQQPAAVKHLPFIDHIFCVSEFHRQQVAKIYTGAKDANILATFNGVDYGMFEELRKDPLPRKDKTLVFASRPERGLEELVGPGGIMELLPEFQLHVCGYDNTVPEMRDYYQYLWGRCNELPNVKMHGPLGKSALYDLLARSSLYVYPTTFEDTSNIMLLEANAVGTPFVGVADHAALPETGKGGGVAWVPLQKGKIDREGFARKIRAIMTTKGEWQRLSDRALSKKQSWAEAAEQWSRTFHAKLAEKCSSKIRLYKHLERMSDIMPMWIKEGENVTEMQKYLPDFGDNYKFMIENDFKAHYDAYYQYEEDRGVKYGPESLSGGGRFEHTFGIISGIRPKRILDYGCAHGHYVMNIVDRNRAGNVWKLDAIHGADLNQKNIGIAEKWRDDYLKASPQATAITFQCGTVDDVVGEFDVILAAEVLEHVTDPAGLVEKLKTHLAPGGVIVCSTPYGPWEAVGYKLHPGWRAHLWQFERADIFEMFAGQDEFRFMAIPHQGDFGHSLFYFKKCDVPVGKIDLDRKMRQQAPRETVSACLIALDSEDTIAKTIKSLEGIADEVIVGVDEKTKDGTREVCLKLGAKVLDIPSPMESGFDAARNLTIEPAIMDWILWVDSDETLERPENIGKYLRPNCFDSYGVPQHHFSCEPACIIKTDFPARFFRNHRGIKFWGVVHEHPETEINAGPGQVMLVDDFSIMHTGYSSEAIRRERFARNWPLMQRDHEKYPNRILGKFLWMRDCAHIVKYSLENGNGFTREDLMNWCNEGIRTWREMLKEGNPRLMVDAMPFYSEMVHHSMGHNGIEYRFLVGSRRMSASRDLPENKPVVGLFANVEDIKNFSSMMVEKNLESYEERYF